MDSFYDFQEEFFVIFRRHLECENIEQIGSFTLLIKIHFVVHKIVNEVFDNFGKFVKWSS